MGKDRMAIAPGDDEQATAPARDGAGCSVAPAPGPSGAVRTSGPCDCLPATPEGWPVCASCGLAQRPGKEFCTFCGRRWVSEVARTTEAPAAPPLP